MEKLLTISVAAYNMEAYLAQTLDSLCVPEVMDELEVLIINDGSTDSTPEIAREYERRAPSVFRLIEKENGGYGSTVNRSMKEAKGKYFRLLDGDDYVLREGLIALVEALRDSTADLVITRFCRVKDGAGEDEFNKITWFPWAHLEGKTVRVQDLDCELRVGMWPVNVKTSLLRKHPFVLPEHRLYTDQQFVVHILPFVRTITFLPDLLYCYRVGRDGQSVSRESRIRNRGDMMDSFRRILLFYRNCGWDPATNRQILTARVGSYFVFAVLTLLLEKPNEERFLELASLMRTARECTPKIYEDAVKRSSRVALLHYSCGLAYWILAGHVENWT